MLSKKELIPILNFSKEHWAVISTLFIAVSIGTSLYYSKSYFDKFGVSYLHFADFSDLIKLLFLSKTFFISIILFALLFILVSLLNAKVPDNHERVETKESKFKKFASISFAVATTPILIMILIGPFTSPYLDASAIKNGNAAHYYVTYFNEKNSIECANIIGVSSNNYLFWDFINEKTLIVPKSQIVEFKLKIEEHSNSSSSQDVDAAMNALEKRMKRLEVDCEKI